MKSIISLFLALVFAPCLYCQELYFPPLQGNTWETVSPSSLGWCEDSIPALIDYLDASNTKAFIVLKDGKIVMEQYFDDFLISDLWYWASAAKSLTAFMVGIAQEDGYLSIDEPTSNYLGSAWTNMPVDQENQITIWNQLTMTSGIDDNVGDLNCFEPSCLNFLEEPGNRWAYHNAPYTLLDQVLENATSTPLNTYIYENLSLATGINGFFLMNDDNANVFYSRPRMMARFGLLMLNQGNWNGTPVLSDMEYFQQMITSSQSLNEAYGLLWWLNNTNTFMLPQINFTFNGKPMPDAPSNLYSAMGKNGQIINVYPDEKMVVVRVGDAPTNEIFFVPNAYNNEICKYMSYIACTVQSDENIESKENWVSPNPVEQFLYIENQGENCKVNIYNLSGQLVLSSNWMPALDVSSLTSGVYILEKQTKSNTARERIVVK